MQRWRNKCRDERPPAEAGNAGLVRFHISKLLNMFYISSLAKKNLMNICENRNNRHHSALGERHSGGPIAGTLSGPLLIGMDIPNISDVIIIITIITILTVIITVILMINVVDRRGAVDYTRVQLRPAPKGQTPAWLL